MITNPNPVSLGALIDIGGYRLHYREVFLVESGHHLHWEQPTIVVATVQRMVEGVSTIPLSVGVI